MQTARMLGGFAIVLVSVWTVRADPVPAKITIPEVQVRSGPSPEFYATSKLHKGDTVRVLQEEETGWLAIEPPPDSFGWIDTRLVEQLGPNAAVVIAPEAPIWVGSRLVNAEPTVSRRKATKGTQLTVLGKAERARDGMRLPIRPVPAEVRYIPAEAIRPGATAPPVAAAAPAATSFPVMPPAANPAVPAAPLASTDTNSLWLQAEDAERVGNFARAEALYQQLADQVSQTDFALRARCLNRIVALRERNRTDPRVASANGSSIASGSTQVPASSAPPAPTTYRPIQRAPSEYCYVQDPGYTARLSSPVPSTPNPPPPAGAWSDLGRLRRTALPPLPDGRPLYRLDPFGPNQRHMYVAAGPDVKLEPYVERNIYLYGPVVYSGELRTNFMTVLQVRPVR